MVGGEVTIAAQMSYLCRCSQCGGKSGDDSDDSIFRDNNDDEDNTTSGNDDDSDGNDDDSVDGGEGEGDNGGNGDDDTNFVMGFVITLFFRIIHYFNISNSAASRLLAFVSFLLGIHLISSGLLILFFLMMFNRHTLSSCC